MSYHCCWCRNMIMDWTDTTTFLSKAIHLKCLVKLRREFKKQYGFEIPKGRKEKDYDGQKKV